MLVLTRRAGESLMIGDEVVVTVLEVRGDLVRIGVDAPRSVPVHREEVFRELQAANREAACADETAVAELRRLLEGRTGGSAGDTPAP
ncbi:carbon storage regulator CsrA [Actinomadura hibisca]|uniref:carbon storage regulator CsrA n=1 Tax=Actinomadura hibisca TaxID=68565 RepID=UPI000834FE64|nr:carbon storage regulator CsrA [Actinomadura hibisca]